MVAYRLLVGVEISRSYRYTKFSLYAPVENEETEKKTNLEVLVSAQHDQQAQIYVAAAAAHSRIAHSFQESRRDFKYAIQ